MQDSRSLAVFQDLEIFHRGLLRKDERVLEKALYPFVSFVKSLATRGSLFSELFLELLIKISRILYLKSQFVLSRHLGQPEEIEESSEENPMPDPLCIGLPLDKALWEKIFLPVPSREVFERVAENGMTMESQGDLTELLKSILRILEGERMVKEVAERIPEKSIEDYIERVREILDKKGVFTFEELTSKIDFSCPEGLIHLVYYFLAVLFLCFQGICSVVQQREFGEIQVFKNT
jgi:chromatin segregation and condensation protein Rec8/ScpA/Scc1 (kleisin family)